MRRIIDGGHRCAVCITQTVFRHNVCQRTLTGQEEFDLLTGFDFVAAHQCDAAAFVCAPAEHFSDYQPGTEIGGAVSVLRDFVLGVVEAGGVVTVGHFVGFFEQPLWQFDVRGRADGCVLPIGLNLFDGGVGLATRGTGMRTHAVGLRRIRRSDGTVIAFIGHTGECGVGIAHYLIFGSLAVIRVGRADHAVVERQQDIAVSIFKTALNHVFVDGGLIGVGHRGDVVGAFRTAFDFEAGGAGIDQIVEVTQHVHVL